MTRPIASPLTRRWVALAFLAAAVPLAAETGMEQAGLKTPLYDGEPRGYDGQGRGWPSGPPARLAPQRGQGRQGGPPSARASAPVDLIGIWVSIVTEDWRWRMRTPPKGDYASLPLTDAA